MNGCWQLKCSDIFPRQFLSQSILSCNTSDIYYFQSVTSKDEDSKSRQTESSYVTDKDKIIITRFQQDTRREILEADIKVLQYRSTICKDNNETKIIFSVFDCSSTFDTLTHDTHGPLPHDRCIESFHLNYIQNEIVVNLEVCRDGQVFEATRYLKRYERPLPPELLKHIKSTHSKETSRYVYPQSVSLTSRHVTSIDVIDLNSQLLEKRYLKSSLLDHITFEIIHTCEMKDIYTPSIIRRRGAVRRIQIDGFDEATSRKLVACVEGYSNAYNCKPSVRVFLGRVKYGDSLCWYVCHRYNHYYQFNQFLLETLSSTIPCLKMRTVPVSVDEPSATLSSPNTHPHRLYSSAGLPQGRQSEVDLGDIIHGRPSETQRDSFRPSTSNASAADSLPLVFDFPPKMIFGNDDATLCYQRRVKLENYVKYLLMNRKRLTHNLNDLLLWFLDVPAQLQQFSYLNETSSADAAAGAEYDSKVKRISAAARDAIRLQTTESHQLTLCLPDTVTVASDNPKIDHFPPILRDQIKRTLQGNGKKKSKLSFYFVEVSFGPTKWVLVYRYTEFQALHKFIVKELERSIKELTAQVTALAAQVDDERAYEEASARLDKLTDSQHHLPHFPWKRIDLMSQADKVTSKRRGQFEAYLMYLLEKRAFYSEAVANVLLHFLEFNHHYKHRQHFTRGYKEMLSQPHEYTSLHADRASIGPISKQLSSTGQRDKEVVSPYMSFMRKQFSFSGPSSDVESSENTNDDDNDDDDNDYNDECGENEGSGSSPVNASSNASVRVEGSISNKMSGLFRPLGSLIEKARSLSRGRTRGTPTSDTTDQSRSESRGKGRMSTGQDTSIIYNERSVSNGRDRDSQRVSVNRSESRGKIRVDMQENNETSDSARHRSPARSPGTSKEKKSLLRPPIFSLSDDEN